MMEDHSTARRRPKAVRLDGDAGSEKMAPEARNVTILPEAPGLIAAPDTTDRLNARPGRNLWTKLALSASAGLVSLATGLAVADLVSRLFSYSTYLGSLGLLLTIILTMALIALGAREFAALARLARVEHLRARAEATLGNDDRDAARSLAGDLTALYASRPDMARARGELARHMADIVDGADLVRLAERRLMQDLDRQAITLITHAARRVSIVTAVAPRAIFDVAMVIAQSAILVRKLAELYGARPGGLASLKLARVVLGHLAVTGGMALGEGVVEQLLGHGLAAKLSAKLGEGMVNGMMTARVGLSTLDVVRPLPFTALARPKLGDILAELAHMT